MPPQQAVLGMLPCAGQARGERNALGRVAVCVLLLACGGKSTGASSCQTLCDKSPSSVTSAEPPPSDASLAIGPPDAGAPSTPVLTPDAPLAAATVTAAVAKCPAWLDRAGAARVRIEQLAAAGDACGKAALARLLLSGAPGVDDFRRALRLASEAQDAQLSVGLCQLFQLANDFPRLARCYELIGDHRALSIEYVTGRALPRDLERARRELALDESQDCGYSALLAVIDEEQRAPTQRSYDFCRDVACTTLDLNGCGSDANFRYGWTSAVLRQRVIDVLDAPGRAAYERLLVDFTRFVDADSSQAYYRFIDGTIRNAVALGVSAEQAQRFNANLERLAIQRSLAPHTPSELAALRAELAAMDRSALSESTSMQAENTRSFHREYRGAAAAYQRFESSWAAFAARVLGGSAETERAARGTLIRARIELLKKSSTLD